MIIVDDEPLARERARRLLEKVGGVEILQEFGDAREALAFIESEPLDVVLLDINMPELDGLRLIEALDDPPSIILATAYEHYAVKAFDLDVVDYLMKPFSTERLGKALSRVRRQLGVSPPNSGAGIVPAEDKNSAACTARRIPADTGRGVELIPTDRLAGAVIEESVVFLLRDDGERLCFAGTLQELEMLLPQPPFLRASRAGLANLELVRRFELTDEGGLLLELHGNHHVQVSRRRARFFRNHLRIRQL